jgi:hypothetical protein
MSWLPISWNGYIRGSSAAVQVEGDETDARLWEIAENLHRAELTVSERAEHIAEWVRLTNEKMEQQPAQVAPPVRKHGHAQPGSGINAAVRELGIDRTEAQRAVKIASIAPEAKEAARVAGLATFPAAPGSPGSSAIPDTDPPSASSSPAVPPRSGAKAPPPISPVASDSPCVPARTKEARRAAARQGREETRGHSLRSRCPSREATPVERSRRVCTPFCGHDPDKFPIPFLLFRPSLVICLEFQGLIGGAKGS